MAQQQPKTQIRFRAAIPWIACTDVPAMLEFFETRLGFTTEWTWGEPPTDAGVQRDEVRLYFFANPDLAARVNDSEITIAVDPIDALFEEHQRRGAPIRTPIRNEPWGSREYHVTTPQGYVLRFSGEQI